ncbi:MAG: hypothetical protein K0U84_08790 [Actinomycetia bacterium]|nr:hypothetical protein [Actinomycetes bacterium]
MPQPERDAAAAHAWAEFARSATDHDLSMLYIENVYDRAYRGSKAVVSLYGDGPSASNDAWFWWEHVQPGSVVAVRLSKGWGSHTRRDGVLYIGNGGTTDQSGIYATFGARELTQAQRHFQQQGIAGP